MPFSFGADFAIVALSALSLTLWLYLILLHGRYWRCDEKLDDDFLERWPEVVAVVPARNEAEVIGSALSTLLEQDYAGHFQVIMVDDHSEDGTGRIARDLAGSRSDGPPLSVVDAQPLPPGWVGKMWAVHQGLQAAEKARPGADYVWLTDADIAHDPGTLRRLVAKAERDGVSLVSLMVKLHCRSFWERLLIPAFVYFFQKLFPFPRVNDSGRRDAGAAGGCMLVRRDALDRIDGVTSIRAEIIDDCALARAVKRIGPIWLGLTETERSIRPYSGLPDIWRMIARTAYTQLRHSPLYLLGTILGMLILYAVPPLVVLTWPLHGVGEAGAIAAVAWIVMAGTYLPTLKLYEQPRWAALLLPLAALIYTMATLDSARRHLQGRGGRWKGRDQAEVAG